VMDHGASTWREDQLIPIIRNGRYAEECRFVHADGSVRWVSSRGQTLSEGEGAAQARGGRGQSRRISRVTRTSLLTTDD
jgi:PAS domain-containing protein